MREITDLAGFDRPDSLRLFFLLIPLVLFNLLHFRMYLPQGNFRVRYFFSSFFFILCCCCLVLALASPRWGYTIRSEYRRGADIILAFDLSRSMNVRDLKQDSGENLSRLEAAVSMAGELTAALRQRRLFPGITAEHSAGSSEIRLAVVIGKGRGILAIPLTADMEALSNFLLGLDASAMGGTGTNLEALLDAALDAFDETFPSNRSIILFSDGESLSGSLSAAAEKARGKGAAISCIGMGSEAGGTVPLGNTGLSEAFLMDGGGSPVISRLERDALRNAAEQSGGIYLEGSSPASIQALAGYAGSLVPENSADGVILRREPKPQSHIFTIAALFFLGLSYAARLEKRRMQRGRHED
ncbi:MAG: VWA domain-containing protein [Treponema sp.]|jgi:Ca-activated chloride channel family protein|nr:VWA domain-containing protein [Treponema sp.]